MAELEKVHTNVQRIADKLEKLELLDTDANNSNDVNRPAASSGAEGTTGAGSNATHPTAKQQPPPEPSSGLWSVLRGF